MRVGRRKERSESSNRKNGSKADNSNQDQPRTFREEVASFANPDDGSTIGILLFIAECNARGYSNKEHAEASWIRNDLLTPKARRQIEERRNKCGFTAREVFGDFNPNPEHSAKKDFPR